VVCIDEFDKLATTRNTARFDGAGTTKDVSGLGVQRELLKLLEGSEVHVPLDFNNTCYSERITISTEDIAFICCGAFSGFKSAAISKMAGIGFEKELKGEEKETIAVHLQESLIEDTENFSIYGFLPELIGRFNRIIALEPLSKEVLKDILVSNVVEKYKKEFSLEGFELEVDDEVLDMIVEESLKKQTGARGLNSALSKYIEEAAFGLFGQKKKGRVCLKVEEGKIVHRVYY
jgi:ATP-dependent Clp protease ATP-binding subunit ClpX